MSRAQWILVLGLAASSYNVGAIWMVQIGYQIWPYVAPSDFRAYHGAWWLRIIPVVFPVAALALFTSIAMIWWRPEGVGPTALWVSVASQVATYTLTGALWARWQAQLQYAKLADGSLDPIYTRIMSTHWLRVALLTGKRPGCFLDDDRAYIREKWKVREMKVYLTDLYWRVG